MNNEVSQNNNQVDNNQPVLETLDLNPTQSIIPTTPVQSITPSVPVQQTLTVASTQPAPVQQTTPVVSAQPVTSAAPVQPVTPAAPVQPVQLATPVQQAVPATPVQSASTQQTAPIESVTHDVKQTNSNNEFSSLELNANDLLLNNAENKTDNNNQIIVPSENKQIVTEINTTTKKTNNAIIFILIVILALVSYFFNDIANFYQEKLFPLFNNDNDKNSDNNITNNDNGFNLVDGYIKVGEPSSYINLKDIKFYNFRKNDSGKYISFNYLSSVKYSDVKDEEIYLELYNSNKEILYKELFDSESVIDKDSVSTYKLSIDESEYNDVFYALVKIYSDSEKKSTSKLVCTYQINNEFINLKYTNTYEFVNNSLTKYSVSKGYEKLQDNAIILGTQEEIKNEYMNIAKYNIASKYNDVSLEYSIDLSNYPREFNPLYEKGTIITIIKNKEKLKGWECK